MLRSTPFVAACSSLVLALATTSCAGGEPTERTEVDPTTAPTTTAPPRLAGVGTRLQRAVDEDLAADAQLVGQMVRLEVGDESVTAAAGFADPSTGTPIDPSMSLRIASVTKTFVAAATLRLVERDELALDAPIGPLLPAELTRALVDGGYDPGAITVRHLLTHTGGVLDFTFAPGLGFVEQVIADPQREWTRLDQVRLAMQGDPVAAPGTTYHYSDTGYALLGSIIEQTTGTDLGTALRSLLRYDRLGLRHTYLERVEASPAGQPPRVHQFFGELDTFGWNPSLDLHGGGGLVSTLADLITFFTALLEGRVFDRPETLRAMLTVPEPNRDVRIPGDPRPYAAAAGLFRSEVAGTPCWGHEGFWGVSVTVCPDLDAAYATSVSQATRGSAYDPARVIAVLHAAATDSAD